MSTPGDRSLRVLHLITTLDRGGAENALLGLVRSFRRKRVNGAKVASSVAYLKGPGELTPEFEAAGATVHDLGRTLLGQAGSYGRARRLVRYLDPEVVHTHLFKADCLGAALCGPREGRTRPRLVSTKHNEDAHLAGDGPKPRALRAVARRVAGRANAVVAISEGVQTFFVDTLGEEWERMQVIPYDPPAMAPGDGATFRSDAGVLPGTPLAVCLARFVPQKDHRTLLEAFARVPGDARLVLLGRGPLESEIREQAAGDPRVIVHGFVDDPRHALTAADVVVLSSRHEGLGLVLLEAAQLGVPTVATRVGGIPEAVFDGTAGLLVPPGDPAALASALERVLFDPDLRQRLSLGARGAAQARATHAAGDYSLHYVWSGSQGP